MDPVHIFSDPAGMLSLFQKCAENEVTSFSAATKLLKSYIENKQGDHYIATIALLPERFRQQYMKIKEVEANKEGANRDKARTLLQNIRRRLDDLQLNRSEYDRKGLLPVIVTLSTQMSWHCPDPDCPESGQFKLEQTVIPKPCGKCAWHSNCLAKLAANNETLRLYECPCTMVKARTLKRSASDSDGCMVRKKRVKEEGRRKRESLASDSESDSIPPKRMKGNSDTSDDDCI